MLKIKNYEKFLNLKIEKLLNAFYDNKQIRLIIFAVYLCLMVGSMFVLNKHTTLIVDDYSYSFSGMTGARITSFLDVFWSQYHHYFSWGGRSVVHFLAQTFLMYDKIIFDVANAIAYVALILVVYFHSIGKFKIVPGLLVILNFSFLAFVPAFGQVFLWLVGSCNYLWGPLLTFTYLLVYRFQLETRQDIIKNKFLAVSFGILGIICAWTNENLAVSIVALSALYNFAYYKSNKKLCFWGICSLLGVTLGAILLILAPGNFVRLNTIHNVSHIKNFLKITRMFFDAGYLLIPIVGSLILYTLNKKRLNWNILLFYISGLIISMYSMVGAPFYADRAKIGSLLFCVIIFGYLYDNADFSTLVAKKIGALILITMISLTVRDFGIGYKDIILYEKRDNLKVEYVLREKSLGNLDVIIPNNYPNTKYCAAWKLEDISTDCTYWTNTSFAKYFGLKSVRVKENIEH